jgi:hypothetical protein
MAAILRYAGDVNALSGLDCRYLPIRYSLFRSVHIAYDQFWYRMLK